MRPSTSEAGRPASANALSSAQAPSCSADLPDSLPNVVAPTPTTAAARLSECITLPVPFRKPGLEVASRFLAIDVHVVGLVPSGLLVAWKRLANGRERSDEVHGPVSSSCVLLQFESEGEMVDVVNPASGMERYVLRRRSAVPHRWRVAAGTGEPRDREASRRPGDRELSPRAGLGEPW